MKRNSLIVTLIASVIALSIAAVSAMKSQLPAQTAVDALVYLPAGLPLAFTNLNLRSEKTDNGKFDALIDLKFQATGVEDVTGLSILLLEFDASGKLRRVDGWVRETAVAAGKVSEITLPLERKLRAGNRLVLAVDRAGSERKRWEIDLPDLVNGAARLVTNSSPVTAPVKQDQPVVADSGAALCGGGYRRAMALAQAGDRSGLTSYTCDQQQRSFQFTFNGKVITQ